MQNCICVYSHLKLNWRWDIEISKLSIHEYQESLNDRLDTSIISIWEILDIDIIDMRFSLISPPLHSKTNFMESCLESWNCIVFLTQKMSNKPWFMILVGILSFHVVLWAKPRLVTPDSACKIVLETENCTSFHAFTFKLQFF